jgi:hypothetical protein
MWMKSCSKTSHGGKQRPRGRPAGLPLLVRIFAVFFPLFFLSLAGCGHFSPHHKGEYVYVSSRRPLYLRDRVAPVSNHTAQVGNGDRLQVLEQMHRFLKVRTEQGAVGWIEAPAVIDQSVYNGFVALQREHAQDPVIARAVLRDAMYLHLAPGRKTEHFLLLPANAKLEMLARVSVPKVGIASVVPQPSAVTAAHKPTKQKKAVDGNEGPEVPMPDVPMDDWWLVRDSAGHTGWMLGRQLDVDVPDEIAQYAEGQRMVGAYVLRTVNDAGPGGTGQQVPEYLAVLTPYKDGLPYDFDQVRVFTWDGKHHRYGTAFRQRNLVGYFPVTVGQQDLGSGSQPVFSIRVAANNAVTLDPATGEAHPSQMEVLTYRMEGNIVRRVLPPGEKAAAPTQSPGTRPGKKHAHLRITK